MPSLPELTFASRQLGRLIRPISFDPIQLMLWELEGANTLQLEVPSNGRVTAYVSLTPEVSGSIARELRAIRDNGMVGVWKLGAWPRSMTFRFRGLTDSGEVRGLFTNVVVFPVSGTSFRARHASFSALLQQLEVLSSNKAMERTGYA